MALGGAFHHDDTPGDITLNLTALMDILSNLLFFLLASYTAQAMEIQDKPDLKLPSSASQVKLSPSLTVTVTQNQILVADVPVAGVRGADITGTKVDGDKISTLHVRLENIRSSRAAAGKLDEGVSAETFMLLADKRTDSVVITKVLKTAGMAGFVNVKFGVIAQ